MSIGSRIGIAHHVAIHAEVSSIGMDWSIEFEVFMSSGNVVAHVVAIHTKVSGIRVTWSIGVGRPRAMACQRLVETRIQCRI